MAAIVADRFSGACRWFTQSPIARASKYFSAT
jgi:hypothetical protein